MPRHSLCVWRFELHCDASGVGICVVHTNCRRVSILSETSNLEAVGLPHLIVFPNRIRKMREEAGIAQREFAKRAGLSTGHLSYIERGLRRPRDDKLAQIAAILSVTPDKLAVGPDSADEYELWRDLQTLLREEASPTLLFGSRLREYRVSRHLSMQELSDRCGTIQSWQIRQFEVAGRQPEPEELRVLAAAFGFETVDEFHEALSGVVLDIAPDLETQEGRASIVRGINRAVRALDGVDLEAVAGDASAIRKAAKSRSLDGDLLAEANPILAGAVIRLVRPTSLRDHMLCVVMNGNAPAGIGRLIAGHVAGPTGRPLMGDLWRVESINFLSRVL